MKIVVGHILAEDRPIMANFCAGKQNGTLAEHNRQHKSTNIAAAGFGRHGMPQPTSNDTGTALGRLITWPCDLDLWSWRSWHLWWCGSSSSIRVPSLKFAGLVVRNIWHTMCVSINGPGDFDLWPFDLETSMRIASKVGNPPSKFGLARPLRSLVIRYVRDGRTKATLIAHFLRGREHNK